MAIYDLFEEKVEQASEVEQKEEVKEEPYVKGSRLFSTIAARFFFFLLFIADILWGVYSIFLFTIHLAFNSLTLFRSSMLKRAFIKSVLSIKRSTICGISLFISFFSPSMGIMIACTYFLMYDKDGIEEVVPKSLQSQFKEFLS